MAAFKMKMWLGFLVFVMIFWFGIAGTVYGKGPKDPQMTGLPEITPGELQHQNTRQMRVKKIKLNKLGVDRVNQARRAKGLNRLSGGEAAYVGIGKEVDGVVGAAPAPELESGQMTAVMPASVDNSTLKYFPPIRSQGEFGSCGVFSGTYYAMTYMYALSHDLDAKNGGEANCFSPKWTYNMVNGGDYNNGSWYYWAYEIGQKNGCATFAEFPYNGSASDPANYREWCMDKTVWRNSINRRIDQYGYVDATHTDAGINQLKQMLVNGYILNIPTYIYSWQTKAIGNDPSTSADDLFAGKACAYWVNGTSGYHGMTLVGYNDDIWVDINGNDAVDPGEKGAFRIANSWGAGWGEGGFCWMAYDALKNPSAVAGGPSAGRVTGFYPSRAHWVTARSAYQPTMVAEFTLNHLKRNQLRMTLGLSDLSRTIPSTTWTSAMINYSKFGGAPLYNSGPYAFNGSTTAVDATFFLDFSEIAPASPEAAYRYYVGIYDGVSGDPVTLSSYKLIDVLNGSIETLCYDVPKVADASQVYAYADYCYDNGNIQPAAVAAASPLSGRAALTVQFDGSGSYDMDGSIVSYSWNFGDGTSAAGPFVSHTYSVAGTYTAILTVTDDNGATDQDSVSIVVTSASAKEIYISDIVMSYKKVGVSKTASAVVAIKNGSGKMVSGATVTGNWSGALTGTASVKTNSYGKATFVSKKTINKGVATFTVTKVSASGYTYNPGMNVKASASITLP
ncbi:MAG: PKD domain-containing protein [Desulfobacterales bacterium]|nr:PKD domain-containing protein [Desulfobacterales bacterium]